ncbi:hypothetical protein CLOP_g3396 [Closterium sp. NIES-67]|nr:hypothetical protein CLOP_g3396 [Closterium sp. NIES-67]
MQTGRRQGSKPGAGSTRGRQGLLQQGRAGGRSKEEARFSSAALAGAAARREGQRAALAGAVVMGCTRCFLVPVAAVYAGAKRCLAARMGGREKQERASLRPSAAVAGAAARRGQNWQALLQWAEGGRRLLFPWQQCVPVLRRSRRRALLHWAEGCSSLSFSRRQQQWRELQKGEGAALAGEAPVCRRRLLFPQQQCAGAKGSATRQAGGSVEEWGAQFILPPPSTIHRPRSTILHPLFTILHPPFSSSGGSCSKEGAALMGAVALGRRKRLR